MKNETPKSPKIGRPRICPDGGPSHQVYTYLPQTQHRWLEKVAADRAESLSQVLRSLIENEIERSSPEAHKG